MTDVSEIFVDVATGVSENAPARTGRHRTDPMTIVLSNTTATWRFMIYLFLEAAAEPCASLNFRAQSSQQTSTVFPPILTLNEFPSSLQSQAAQVVSTMTLLSPARSPGTRAVGHERRECRCQNL
jgi:hypothetical protein